MTAIEKATSGFPVFIIDTNNSSGANLENTNDVSQIRPNQTCNPVLSHPTLSEWFNPACASPSRLPLASLENANRTPLSGSEVW